MEPLLSRSAHHRSFPPNAHILHIYRSKLPPRACSHGTGPEEDYPIWTVEGSLPCREGQTRRRYHRTDEVAASDWLIQDWMGKVTRIMNFT